VSGDFFWLAKKENRLYIAVADCTGHGVPGALVSVIGVNMLNKVIELPGLPSPAEMLEVLHDLVIHALNKDATARDTNDGMDIGLLCIDEQEKKAWFAGAARPLHYFDGTIHHVRGDRYSIAGEKKNTDEPFAVHEIPLKSGMCFYLSSDGFADQFGEVSGKKFMTKRYQELLETIGPLHMHAQREKIDEAFTAWKGKLEQVDDILVIGIKVR
jgi:serine phosphatase RsbU (regulator of sigma subunit)